MRGGDAVCSLHLPRAPLGLDVFLLASTTVAPSVKIVPWFVFFTRSRGSRGICVAYHVITRVEEKIVYPWSLGNKYKYWLTVKLGSSLDYFSTINSNNCRRWIPTAIRWWEYRIPFDLRSQASAGSVSSAVREDARSLGAVVFYPSFLLFSFLEIFLLLLTTHIKNLKFRLTKCRLIPFGLTTLLIYSRV